MHFETLELSIWFRKKKTGLYKQPYSLFIHKQSKAGKIQKKNVRDKNNPLVIFSKNNSGADMIPIVSTNIVSILCSVRNKSRGVISRVGSRFINILIKTLEYAGLWLQAILLIRYVPRNVPFYTYYRFDAGCRFLKNICKLGTSTT